MNHALSYTSRFTALALAVLVALFVAGCGGSGVLPTTVDEEIPEGANRVILERDATTDELTPDPAARSFYIDAQQYLQDAGYGFAETDASNMILITEPKQVNDSLMIRLNVNVDDAAGGSQLIASTEWMPANAPYDVEWVMAEWTKGLSQTAFAETVELLSGLPHSDLATTIEQPSP